MIHYIVKGPRQILEIHHDKLRVIKKGITYYLGLGAKISEWPLTSVASFTVTDKFITGQIYWKTYQGQIAQFRYSGHQEFVFKIHGYIQKVILKNNKRQNLQAIESEKLPTCTQSVAA